jgi:hypothetical protein
MNHTGTFATEDEIESLKASLSQPYIVIGGIPPRSPAEVAHSFALGHGLPEIQGYYGCDLETGEFLTA